MRFPASLLSLGNWIGVPFCHPIQLDKVNADVEFSITLRNINHWCTPGTVARPDDSLLCHFRKLIVNFVNIVKWDWTWKNLDRGGITSVNHIISYISFPQIAACGVR